ncbi:uncharacterized protein [Typha angustifolia]|uniref:uncharacterized protein n=1 Tax=Typha angustifolia TaxID=59011 RepID=UPI003C2ED802
METSPLSLPLHMVQAPELPPPQPQSFHPALHSIQRSPAKPWRKPGFSASQPAQPKVYRVEPRGFRELVQRLTGAPEHVERQLKENPLPLESPPPDLRNSLIEVVKSNPGVNSPGGSAGGELLSPSFYSTWCSFPLLSPSSMQF